jgi:CRP-like cAMP-binding protein
MDLSSFYFNSTPVDEVLGEAERLQLYKNSTESKYTRGINIFEERTYPKGVYILKKGRVKLYQSTSSGTQQIIAIHGAGEIFGYRPILSNERYPVSATTLEPCTVVFIPRRDFQNALEKSTALSNLLLKYLSHEFTVWVNIVSILARTTVKERLLLNILLLAERYREPSKWPVKITLPKADLACLIGTSNETLARMLKLLKQEKLVVSRGSSMEINGPEQLKRIQKEVSLFL